MAAKLVAHKECNKKYRKIIENPMMYLEERYHQIDPAEHQPEVHSLRFFGAGAESAAIEVLVLIDWFTKFLELSRSPIPEIPAFLQRLFVVGKRVQFPILEDPGNAIYKEKCVCTKDQRHGCISACSCSSGPIWRRRSPERYCMGDYASPLIS